ncbi:hypothetical protein ACIQKB_37835 [Streptomyces sp. NPDC092046]|uniref:hypothetical protein n=1 Tax=Streptomyces sp. NPDC092046 TaxID=3366009 RepID=UPI003809CED2
MTGAPAQPRLYVVPPAGATGAARILGTVRRATRAYDGYDEATPATAAFNVGVAYGTWGVRDDRLDVLTGIGYHLTAHAQRVTAAHRYIVTAAYTEDAATVSVLALRGRAAADPALLDPAQHPELQAVTDGPRGLRGWTHLAAGPCLYAGIRHDP